MVTPVGPVESSTSAAPSGPDLPETPHPSVFVSYSHKDRLFVATLEKFAGRGLINLAAQLGVSKIELWSDSELRKSQQWEPSLDAQLAACVMGLVVASADSLRIGSYVSEKEIPALIGDREGEGISARPWGWVLYRSCAFDDYPEMTAQNALISPAVAVERFEGDAKDGHYNEIKKALLAEIALCIREDPRLPMWRAAAEIVAGEVAGETSAEADRHQANKMAATAEPLDDANVGGRFGELFGVPPLPPIRIERTDLVEQVTEALISNSAASITANVGVSGMGLAAGGGFGKSALAALVAHSDRVRRMFPDGIVWVTLGESPNMYEVLCVALSALGHEGRPADLSEARTRYRELIPSKRALVIVDDVWQLAHARPFAVPDGPSRLLMTSRDTELLARLRVEAIDIEQLSPSDAWELLYRTAGWLAVRGDVRLPAGLMIEDLQGWVDRLGRVPLPISVLGSAMKGANYTQVLATLGRLEKAKKDFGDHPYADAFAAIRASLGALGEVDQRRFGLLAVFAEDTEIPTDVTGCLWAAGANDTVATLERLSGLLKLSYEDSDLVGWSVHDHVRDFLLYDLDDLESAHGTLVANLEPMRGDGGWADLACRSQYVRENLLSHMAASGRGLDAAHLATEPRWVICRAIYDGVFAARADLARLLAELTTQQRERTTLELEGWSRLLRSCAEFFRCEIQPAPTTNFADLADQWDPSVVAAQIGAYAHNAGLITDLGRLGLRWWWLRDGAARLSTPSTAQLAVLIGHGAEVSSAAFSSDGSRVASGDDNGSVRVWDAASGEQVVEMVGHTGPVASVEFSSSGSRVASRGHDGSVRVWDAVSGKQVAEMAGSAGSFSWAAFSADGSRSVSGRRDGGLRVWDAVSGEQVAEMVGHTGSVWSLRFSPDGSRVVSGGRDNSVRVWDAVSGEQVVEMVGHTGWVHSVGFSADGSRVVSGDDDGSVRVWDAVSGGQVVEMVGHTGSVLSVGFSADGSRVVSGGDDGSVRVWDAVSGGQVVEMVGHTGSVLSVGFSADGSRVVSGGEEGSVRVWDAAAGGQDVDVVGQTGELLSVGFSADGSRVMSGDHHGSVRVWDAVSGEQVAEMVGHIDWVDSLGFSADGSRVVTGHSDRLVRVWDAVSGGQVVEMVGHIDWVDSLGFSADGSRVVSGGRDGSVTVWDAVSGEQVVEMVGHTGSVLSVGFSADGSRVVSGDGDGSVRVWDAVSGEHVAGMVGHTGSVLSVGFSADGSRVVSGGDDGSVRVWDAVSGGQVVEIVGHTGWVLSVGFSADGSRVVSGGDDGSVRVWDAATGSLSAVLRLHGEVQSIAVGQQPGNSRGPQVRLAVGYGRHASVIRVCWRQDETDPRFPPGLAPTADDLRPGEAAHQADGTLDAVEAHLSGGTASRGSTDEGVDALAAACELPGLAIERRAEWSRLSVEVPYDHRLVDQQRHESVGWSVVRADTLTVLCVDIAHTSENAIADATVAALADLSAAFHGTMYGFRRST